MQSHEQVVDNGASANTSSQAAKAAVNGDTSGKFHGQQSGIGGYAERHPQRANIPSINTAKILQNNHMVNEMRTSVAAMDVNFTPLLPSQLLLGSPFQPGSPGAFSSGQFQSLAAISHHLPGQLQTQANQANGGVQNQANPIASQVLQGLMSPLSPSFFGSPQSPTGGLNGMNAQLGTMPMTPTFPSGTSRTVYLGNVPPDTSPEELLNHVRSGQIESVRILPDKNCAFISFLDSSSAIHFHSDAILKKLAIKGQDIKVGWGKPSQVPTTVAIAVQQSGASRNVYLGNLPEEITEDEIREDLGKFGPIDTVKLVPEKSIGFVHFLTIAHAIKAVTQLPQEPKWQPPRRVYYGKDRCAYVSKTQQQNAAQYLGIAPGYAHILSTADRDMITTALAQQSVAAAAVATAAGGANNLGNRTVYLGNIHPETTIEEICNVVRGGLLHHIRYIPDKHICFVTFIDPTSAASFYALSNLQGLMIHNRRLKIGWGKHSGALPPAIALAVSGGASRNVYIGNLDESWTEDRLRQDFSEYGEIELVNTLREKSCAFVNFTNIANAIKAIEGVRGKDEYKRFKINFGKDRCGNPPRQVNGHSHNALHESHSNESNEALHSPSPLNGFQSGKGQSGSPFSPGLPGASGNGPLQSPTGSSMLNSGSGNPLMMYLQQQAHESNMTGALLHEHEEIRQEQGQQQPAYSSPQAAFYSVDDPSQGQGQGQNAGNHGPGNGFNLANGTPSGAPTIGGMLAPSLNSRGQHARTVSLPSFSQGPFTQQPQSSTTMTHNQPSNFGSLGSGIGGFGGNNGFGMGVQVDNPNATPLQGWVEEQIEAQ